MPGDIVREFGYLTLGSRFRRIGERLQIDTQAILDAAGLALQAGQCPLIAALDRDGPLTIGELAVTLGITQPGATRAFGQLEKLGYVEARTSPEDQRRKLVSLTTEGKALVEHCKREVWPQLERSVADLCAELDGPLLVQLAGIEDGLSEASLIKRSRNKEK